MKKAIYRSSRLTAKIALLCSGFFLAGCDFFDSKPPLSGKREIVTAYTENLSTQAAPKTPLSVSKGIKNTQWSMPGGNPTHTQEPVALSDSPQKIWSISMGAANGEDHRVTASPIVADGRAFAVDGYGKVTAVQIKTGEALWQFDSSPAGEEGQGIGGGVSLCGSTVYLSSPFGEVIALNAANGQVRWRTKVGAPMRVGATISGGTVYALTINNEVVAVSEDTGKILWTYKGLAESAGLLGGASPAVIGDKVIATLSSGEVIALSASTGQTIWTETISPSISADSIAGIAHIRARPVVLGNSVIIISHAGQMLSLDLETGARRWSHEISGLRSPALGAGHVFLVDMDNRVMALNAQSGAIRWIEPLPQKHDNGRIDWAGPIIAGGQLILVGSQGKGVFISPDTGKVTKEFDVGNGASVSPIVANGILFVLTNDAQLVAYQ